MRMSSLKWSSSWPKRIESNGIESENKAKSNMQSAEKGARDAL